MPESCEHCSQKNIYIDGEHSDVYGFTCLVIPKVSLVAGNRVFKNDEIRPKHSPQDSRSRYGLLPDEINHKLYDNGKGKG